MYCLRAGNFPGQYLAVPLPWSRNIVVPRNDQRGDANVPERLHEIEIAQRGAAAEISDSIGAKKDGLD